MTNDLILAWWSAFVLKYFMPNSPLTWADAEDARQTRVFAAIRRKAIWRHRLRSLFRRLRRADRGTTDTSLLVKPGQPHVPATDS